MSHDTHMLLIGFKLGGVKKYFSIIISTNVLVKVSDCSKDISTWRDNFEPDPVAQLPAVSGESAKMADLGVALC